MAGAAPIVSFQGSAKYLRDNENGLVIIDDDVQGFAGGILRLLDDQVLAKSLGLAAQEFARTNLSWEANSNFVENIYK